MNDNRIDQLTVAATGTRQTPKNEFGEVLVQTSQKALQLGAQLFAGLPSSPILSAAVSQATKAVGFAESSSVATGQTGVIAGGGGVVGSGGGVGGAGGDAMEALQMQAALQAEGFKMNAMYMGIQREMQRESREFTTVSNIMKVRHDTAKSAINNVR